MKIKHFFFSAICLVVLFLVSIIMTNWNKHILYLTSGEVIEAGKAWVVFDDVYYEKGVGTLYTINKRQVKRIVSASFSLDDWRFIIAHDITARRGVWGVLTNRISWWTMAVGICGFFLFFLVRWFLSYLGRIKQKGDKEDEDLRFIHISPQVSDSKKIILYFLNLYLLQTKAGKKDRYAYRRLDIKGPLNTSVYEYRIYCGGQWQSRRISIGRIGEDSGARSKCFYVIYDDHFVVKMPPEPMTDFNDYIQSIKADRRIADILAPRECLVPGLSMVLKKIPAFAKLMDKFEGDVETRCIKGLKAFPRFKEFFKIAGSFAFYMDLSKYFFLGQILNGCHDISDVVAKELKKYQDMIWIPESFTDRYGVAALDLCFKLQKIFNRFDDELNDASIPLFQKKVWFTDIFKINESSSDFKKIPVEVQSVLTQIKKKHPDTIHAYKKLLQQSARKQSFKQNQARLRSIASRLIELLAWLFFKDIAIRDLKPDNVLVAGDPSKYPHFLNDVNGFELGLIDVEIAAYTGAGSKSLVQPKLGGTPFYATPSHMFINDILRELFNDITYILKLQDWHAIVAMIYQAVIGEKLFANTAGTMAWITRELPTYIGDRAKMMTFAKKANTKFWEEATREFELKIKNNEIHLRSIDIEIFKNSKKMFKIAADKSKQTSIQNQLRAINSRISAYDILSCMFAHIKEVMTGN